LHPAACGHLHPLQERDGRIYPSIYNKYFLPGKRYLKRAVAEPHQPGHVSPSTGANSRAGVQTDKNRKKYILSFRVRSPAHFSEQCSNHSAFVKLLPISPDFFEVSLFSQGLFNVMERSIVLQI
jgi:hypothetical protein